MLLEKENKSEGMAIDKEENLSKSINELNENARWFEMLRETQEKLEVEIDAWKRELNNLKETFSHEQEKTKCNLISIIEQLTSSIEIA